MSEEVRETKIQLPPSPTKWQCNREVFGIPCLAIMPIEVNECHDCGLERADDATDFD